SPGTGPRPRWAATSRAGYSDISRRGARRRLSRTVGHPSCVKTPERPRCETAGRARHMIRYPAHEDIPVTETADVVVVGGGVNGVSIAYALAVRGVPRVVLCEKAALASGASGFSSALVRMHYTDEWDARLAFASFPVFQNWTEIMGGPSVFTHTGFVNVVAPQYA